MDPKLKPGSNRCKCGARGTYFGGVRAFELHRTGPADDRACLAPSGVADRQGNTLLRLNDRGYWIRAYKLVA